VRGQVAQVAHEDPLELGQVVRRAGPGPAELGEYAVPRQHRAGQDGVRDLARYGERFVPGEIRPGGGHVDERAEDDPLGVGEGCLMPFVAARAGDAVAYQVAGAGDDEVIVEPSPGPVNPVAIVLPLQERDPLVQPGRDGQEKLVLYGVLGRCPFPP